MKKQRAFLKWAGGKYSLVDKIAPHFPESKVLVEPFVGAGSIFLNTDYDKYILADINEDLISVFKLVQSNPEGYIADAKQLFTEKSNSATTFYRFRKQFNECKDPYQRALLFLYLNRHGYNGLCRYNKKGAFNVPFGRYKKIRFPEDEILAFSEKAQKAQFICAPYHQVMKKAPKDSVIYCDPPYAPLSESANFTAYYATGFSDKEQEKLAKLAEKLVSKNIHVVISNHNTENTRKWYKNAKTHLIEARRLISRDVKGRNKIDELIAIYS